MPRRVNLTEDKKRRIADLYHNSNLSVGSIAEREGISIRTVHNWKNYGYFQPPDNVSEAKDIKTNEIFDEPEKSYQYDQIQREEQIEDQSSNEEEIMTENDICLDKRSIRYIDVEECPECSNPIVNCLTKNQAFKNGIGIDQKYENYVDYRCPKCKEWFPMKIFDTKEACPGCGEGSSSWVPIDQWPHATDEEIKKYNAVCLVCNELIKINQ